MVAGSSGGSRVKSKPNFKVDLKRGQAGEAKLVEHFHLELLPTADEKERRWDFETKSGLKVEIKSDYYTMDTGNFFMERWSDVANRKLGGPWRAYEDGVDCFVYFYPKDNLYFYFRDVPALIERLNSLTSELAEVSIQNRAWTTIGFKVPRVKLEDLYEVYEWK